MESGFVVELLTPLDPMLVLSDTEMAVEGKELLALAMEVVPVRVEYPEALVMETEQV